MASTDGDSVYLGEPVLLSYVTESALSWLFAKPSDYRPGATDRHIETNLYYYYRAIRRLGVLFRPVANLAADSTRSTADLLDEYFRSDPIPRVATASGYSAIGIPDTGNVHYLAMWVAVGGPPEDWRAPRPRDSSTFLGAVIVDRLHNRIVWSRGGHHAKRPEAPPRHLQRDRMPAAGGLPGADS